MNRKYVHVTYNKETQERLREWCIKNNFNLTSRYYGEVQNIEDFIFHTTILYSLNETDLKDDIIEISKDNKVYATGIKYLGEDLNIPVLTVKSDALQALRELFELKGLIDFWPTYLPHISISYERQTRDLSNIKLPDFDLVFDQLIIEDLEE